jgi:hypothetical protein
MGMLMQRPASISSMLQSIKVVREVAVRVAMRWMTKMCQKRTMPMMTHLYVVVRSRFEAGEKGVLAGKTGVIRTQRRERNTK